MAHGTTGDHRPLRSCPCRPYECVELMGGPLGRVVILHRDLAPQEEAAVLRRVVGKP